MFTLKHDMDEDGISAEVGERGVATPEAKRTPEGAQLTPHKSSAPRGDVCDTTVAIS